MPWFLGNAHMWSGSFFWPSFFIPIAVWSVFWTGLSLWNAAKRGETGWFIFFLFVHTAGIIELVYLLFVVRIQESNQVVKPKVKRSKK